MQRTRVRRLLIVGVMLALSSLGFVLGRTLIHQQAIEPPPADELQPDVSQRIQQFRRVKVKDGEKVWELTAREAEYFQDEGEVVISGPELAFYGGKTGDVALRGNEGKVFLKDGDVEKIEMGGGIEVTVGEYFVETEKAIYFENINSIVAPGMVNLRGSDVALAGRAMLLELGSRRVRFMKGVTTTFHRANRRNGAKPGVVPLPPRQAAVVAREDQGPHDPSVH